MCIRKLNISFKGSECLDRSLSQRNFNVNTITQLGKKDCNLISIQFWTFVFFHIRLKTLKNTLRPSNEQNFDFRIFWFFHQVLKAPILYRNQNALGSATVNPTCHKGYPNINDDWITLVLNNATRVVDDNTRLHFPWSKIKKYISCSITFFQNYYKQFKELFIKHIHV